MTIVANDIKIRASRVMADVPEGGGGPSANVIEWGQSNTMFDDVNFVDRTMGNVSIRQLFLHVDTDNVDRLGGARAMVAKLPADPNVSVMLAACGPFATRSEIQTAIANYLIRGVPWNGLILGNHVQGQASLQLMQRPGTRTPTIGRTMALVIDEGKPSESVEWVRIIKVETEERTYTDDKGDYKALVVMCELASPMAQPVPGSDPNRYFQREAGAAVPRDTTTADAASYYGAAASVLSANIGDLRITTESVYGQLVPSSSTQVPALDQRPAGRRVLTLATTPRLVEVPVAAHTSQILITQENRGLSYIFQMTPRPEPGSIVITWVGLGNRYVVEDTGTGELQGQGAGTANYVTGSGAITLPSLPDDDSAIVIQWAERVAFTDRRAQAGSVPYPSYNWYLDPLRDQEGEIIGGSVEPTSLSISYTSGGQTRTCTADANGVIAGDGTGHVNHQSRLVFLRPSYAPDANAVFECSYELNSTRTDIIASPGAPDAGGFVQFDLAEEPVPGTLEIAWATTHTVTQTVSGRLTDLMKHESRDINTARAMTRLSDRVQKYMQQVGFVGGLLDGQTAFEITDQKFVYDVNDRASRVLHTLVFAAESSSRAHLMHVTNDDGDGLLLDGGAVDYNGKRVTLRAVDVDETVGAYQPDTGGVGGGVYTETRTSPQILADSSIVATYATGTPTPQPMSMSFTPPAISFALTPMTRERIVPGSVLFTFLGTQYQDFEGRVYRDWQGDGIGIESGSLDYATGIVTLTDYAVGDGNMGTDALTVQSLWTQGADWSTAVLFFMTEASPIQPGQLTVNCVDVAGNPIAVTANLQGELSGDHAIGTVDYQNGLVQLAFGDWLQDALLTPDDKAEWWYNPANVQPDGSIWRPWPVDPTSLRYNSVSNLFLPVDPQILGLDPTRLPQDGRVPIFAKGRMICVGYNDALAPNTYTNGQTVQLPRHRLSHVWLIDANGQLIDDGFIATEQDLDAGQVYINDVAGWTQPVRIEYRIQDVRLCTDVQIDGTVAFNFPLSHDFPAGSVVSSVLLFGTIFARVSNVFDQQTWDKVTWSDEVVGNPAPASYNAAAYPIAVTNSGALSERYALQIKSDATTFDLIGEFSGGLGSGSINEDFEPNNPFNHNVKLFRLDSRGWGSGWTAGNTQFLRLEAAMPAFAIIRTVQPSQAAGTDYSFDLLAGGDIDRPPNDAI